MYMAYAYGCAWALRLRHLSATYLYPSRSYLGFFPALSLSYRFLIPSVSLRHR